MAHVLGGDTRDPDFGSPHMEMSPNRIPSCTDQYLKELWNGEPLLSKLKIPPENSPSIPP